MIAISVTDLVKSLDLEKKILDGVSFQIDTGERVGLLGKNGAGKVGYETVNCGSSAVCSWQAYLEKETGCFSMFSSQSGEKNRGADVGPLPECGAPGSSD